MCFAKHLALIQPQKIIEIWDQEQYHLKNNEDDTGEFRLQLWIFVQRHMNSYNVFRIYLDSVPNKCFYSAQSTKSAFQCKTTQNTKLIFSMLQLVFVCIQPSLYHFSLQVNYFDSWYLLFRYIRSIFFFFFNTGIQFLFLAIIKTNTVTLENKLFSAASRWSYWKMLVLIFFLFFF